MSLVTTLTPRKTVEKSCVATPSASPPDSGEGSLAEGASSHRAQFSTPSKANPGESLAPTESSPTSPTDNSGYIARDHPVEATLHTLPTTLPTPTSPTDNPGDGRLQSAHCRLHCPGFLDVPPRTRALQTERHRVPRRSLHQNNRPSYRLPPTHLPPPSDECLGNG